MRRWNRLVVDCPKEKIILVGYGLDGAGFRIYDVRSQRREHILINIGILFRREGFFSSLIVGTGTTGVFMAVFKRAVSNGLNPEELHPAFIDIGESAFSPSSRIPLTPESKASVEAPGSKKTLSIFMSGSSSNESGSNISMWSSPSSSSSEVPPENGSNCMRLCSTTSSSSELALSRETTSVSSIERRNFFLSEVDLNLNFLGLAFRFSGPLGRFFDAVAVLEEVVSFYALQSAIECLSVLCRVHHFRITCTMAGVSSGVSII